MKTKLLRYSVARQWTLATVLSLVCLPLLAAAPSRPGTPSGSLSGSTVSLTWRASTDDVGVAGYNVYINDAYASTVSGNSYSGTVNATQRNSFYVIAFDVPAGNEGSEFSQRSPVLSLRATETGGGGNGGGGGGGADPVPTAPTNLVANRTSATTATLSWTASTDDVGVTGYNVYRNNQYIATVSSPMHTDAQLSAGNEYTYHVVAFDEPRNFSARSAEATVASFGGGGADPVPTAPTNLTAIRTSATTATLSWTASTDDVGVSGYNVYRNNQFITTVSSTMHTDAQLTAGNEYTYYVVAFDEPRNFSARSAEATVASGGQPPEPPEPPQPPEPPVTGGPDTEAPALVTELEFEIQSDGSVLLTWPAGTDNVAVDGYNLYRDGNYLVTVFGNSYTDTTIAADTESVTYSIVAFDEARNFSPNSPELVVVIDNEGTPPTLRDPSAAPIASPDPSDPFGSRLETDSEVALDGGPPTQPKNLRAELVSNDWAELNWAPSNDDGEVVEYKIYRSDGVVYSVRGDYTSDDGGQQNELDRTWSGTRFIDCNYTRFADTFHNCNMNTPKPGDTFFYEVSAIDDEGQESPRSETLEIVYHPAQNGPIPYYNDFYKENDDRFVQEHDLSKVRYFIDDFTEVFTENFNGTSINDDHWNTGLVWGDTRIINGEQQYFVNPQLQPDFGYNPFKFTGSTLLIESIPVTEELAANLPPICTEPDPLGFDRCAFLSGALSSHDKFGITYGYVESRMKVSAAPGALSSFYLYNRYPGTGVFKHTPEIDIIEYLGENPFGDELAFQTHHYSDIDGNIQSAPTMSYANPDGSKYDEAFHTFSVLWEPQLVIWYINGEEIKRLTGPQVSRQQMNIVTYLVAGSAWAPTPDVTQDIFPLRFEVDYIKAYQRGPFRTNGIYP